MSDPRPTHARIYTFRADEFPTINGEMFPWYVSADGPLIEPVDGVPDMHILWVPIFVDAPLPSPPVGHPDGTPLVEGGQ